MARTKRRRSESGIYHVMLRGIVEDADTSALQRLEVAEQGEVARALLVERFAQSQPA